MKFGEYLRKQQDAEWAPHFLNYGHLKFLIKELEPIEKRTTNQVDAGARNTSLTVPRPTDSSGMPVKSDVTAEMFYSYIEDEMRKIDTFTQQKLAEIRSSLAEVEAKLDTLPAVSGTSLAGEHAKMKGKVDIVAKTFLRLEKYVNLNFTGFHKILKKHDKRLPSQPCKPFYISRLHQQSWIQIDHSDIIVTMSRVYTTIRGDEAAVQEDSAKQDFVRSTTKYWVHTEDISAVKYIVLQHLPVFLQDSMASTSDSQLVNSVYLDNHSMELYHGRLDKTPGAIALRMRWYGTGEPELVFVERKTHREAWCGDLSVKERFVVPENEVQPLIDGEFDKDEAIRRMRAKGKSDGDIEAWETLVCEVEQAINSKQLLPTMRTQYMRTAFQIPFDATVRVSLDTNLTMIQERVTDTQSGRRWYRDPEQPVPLTEITRFPHAVLEVKLQLEDENSCPTWVTDLINSGLLSQVHKFSKFIHGCAVLMPEEVRAVPYWIDDTTLGASIVASGAQDLLERSHGANEVYSHLLPHSQGGQALVRQAQQRRAKAAANLRRRTGGGGADVASMVDSEGEGGGTGILGRLCGLFDCSSLLEAVELDEGRGMTPQKVEPKLFFANERTFLHYLHMGVLTSSISVGVLAFSKNTSEATIMAMVMMPVAFCFVLYALNTFLWRSALIRNRETYQWDDPLGPVVLTLVLILALAGQFGYKLHVLFFCETGIKYE